jgi:hypothetical protein
MTDQLNKFSQKTLEDIPSVISLPESEAGAMPCGVLNGLMTDQSGQDRAPVSRSRRQGRDENLRTSAIYGQNNIDLSTSANLNASLESKLRVKMLSCGSTLYTLTWKEQVTPLGRKISVLRASVPRNRDRESISWVTPNARDYRDLSKTRGYLAQRKRHSPSVATKFLELGGNWKQVPQIYRALMGFPSGWHENFCDAMETQLSRKSRKRS